MSATGAIEAAAARVRALWDEGLSLAVIGERIGCTKGAVARFVGRHGLPKRPSPIKRKPGGSSLKHALAGAAPLPTVVPPAPPPPLAVRSCQWPEGEPRTKGFRFCGASPVMEGKPYCAAHTAIAYVRHPRMPAVPP